MTKRTVAIALSNGTVTFSLDRSSKRVLLRCNTGRPVAYPVFKWPGGKQWLGRLNHVLLPPRSTGTYFEPFFGGGALFFSLAPRKAFLSDINADLMEAYQAIKTNVGKIIRALGRCDYSEDFYYYMRSKRCRNPYTRAARMVYLNRTCWNGLYRVNRKGEFNVPFGRFVNPTICDAARLEAASRMLAEATLARADFEQAVRRVRRNDLVYLDPPYTTRDGRNGFLKYNSRLFSWHDQERLASVARDLAKRGARVVVSNADHRQVTRLYRGFNYYKIERNSLIGGTGSKRQRVGEALLSSHPIMDVSTEVL